MFRFVVILQVLDFQLLDEFEREASRIMADYQGKIICAFETARNEDGSGEEIHLVEFQREDDFISYRNDPRLLALRDLRAAAISRTEMKTGRAEKLYA